MITNFLHDLFDHGRVRVGQPDHPDDDGSSRVTSQLLLSYESIRRLSFPGDPPEFSVELSAWSARLFYRACEAATFRDPDASQLDDFLGEQPPTGNDAVRHYSVDLVFQFLPDLVKLCGHAAPGDRLVEILRQWANLWPLSSVGIPGVEPKSLDGIVNHPGLLAYYADRVIARQDMTRLVDPTVRCAVERALSLFSSQFPELAAKLSTS